MPTQQPLYYSAAASWFCPFHADSFDSLDQLIETTASQETLKASRGAAAPQASVYYWRIKMQNLWTKYSHYVHVINNQK